MSLISSIPWAPQHFHLQFFIVYVFFIGKSRGKTMKVSMLKKLLGWSDTLMFIFSVAFPPPVDTAGETSLLLAPISQTSKPKHGDAKDKSDVTQQTLAGFG